MRYIRNGFLIFSLSVFFPNFGFAQSQEINNVLFTLVPGGVFAEGGSFLYTLSLNVQPSSPVIIEISPNDQFDAGNGPGRLQSLVFTPNNFSLRQIITVSVVDDSIVEGNHTGSITHYARSDDPSFNNLSLPFFGRIAIMDNDFAGVTVGESTEQTAVTEGGTGDTYTLVLNGQPQSPITIRVDPDEQTDVGNGPGTPRDFIFTNANWNSPQTVTVTAADDFRIEGPHTSTITHESISLDNNFANLSIASVLVTVTDNDFAGFTIMESDGSTQVDESGGKDTFSVTLNAQPATNVELLVNAGNSHEASVDLTSLTFSPSTWNIPFTIMVTGMDDALPDGDQTMTITLSVADANSDDLFDLLADQAISVTILDDDAADLKVTRTDDPTPDSCRVGDCSLREAIIAANARFGKDVIFLSGGSYVLAITGVQEDRAFSGDLDINEDLTIIGAGETLTTINGNSIDRVFDIDPLKNNIEVTISGVGIMGGNPPGDTQGGGIQNFGILTLKNVILRGNFPSDGGGIGNMGGMLTLQNSIIRDNFAAGIGGGIYNTEGTVVIHNSTIQNNNADYSGGIFNGGVIDGESIPGGTVTLLNSTVSENGGGSIFGSIHSMGTFNLLNTTVSGNTAGIVNEMGTFTILNSTIARNRGTGVRQTSGAVEIQNSIVAENIAESEDVLAENLTSSKTDCRGQITSLGYNFIGTTNDCEYSSGPDDMIATGDLVLGGYVNPGTPGKSHFPLLANSQVIDTGDPAGCKDQKGIPFSTDQLGKRRPIDGNSDGIGHCDRGAIEFYPEVNQYVTFVPVVSSDPTGVDPFGCPAGTMGKFRFNGRLTGKQGAPPLSNLIVQVQMLTNGNILRNADGGPGGMGAILSVGPIDDFSDRVLTENESVRVPFSICLADFKTFRFLVNVLGENQAQQ